MPTSINTHFSFKLILVLLLSFSMNTTAEKLTFVGVLGNSGESGKSLTRFSEQRNKKLDGGLGIHYDQFGTLWSTAGLDRVNRYTLDGRLVATYSLPKAQSHYSNNMVNCNNQLIFLLDKKLYSLSILSEAGTTAKSLGHEAKLIGLSNKNGYIPAISTKDEVLILNEDGSTAKTLCKVPDNPSSIFLCEDDTVNLVIKGNFRTIKDGKLIEEENFQKFGGTGMQKIDNNWYSHAWHGTIKRFDETISPDPGIVLGGSSGSFIGHLAGNYEVSRGTGMAKINNKLFAIGGVGHVIHLMEWKDNSFHLVRRIGPLSEVRGALALDKEGRILVPYGNWTWNDSPVSPLRNSTGRGPNGQISFMDNGIAVGPSLIYGGTPSWSYGKLNGELKSIHDSKKSYKFQYGVSANVVLKTNGLNIAYYIGPQGKAHKLQINPIGKVEKALGSFQLKTKNAVKKWTTFAKVNDDKVYAAGDGFLIEFDTKNKDEWRETKRWKSFQSDSFGNEIHINRDKKFFWVADTDKHRVLCFGHDFKLLATYGNTGKSGADFKHFNSPTTIFGNNNRLVVYDEGNQRLMKFEVK
ncbi:MAG: hypothetical protein NE334_09740 [Lentisphaeraceae bacterium]|nr:hypothetical protein [Lentisphaeraceae bacterium]